MLIKSVVQNEAARNQDMIRQYENLLVELPKGSLICRKGGYYYLKYRDGEKVCDEYIGKDIAIVEDIKQKLELRRHYIDMLSALKKEKKAIQKILEELA